MGLFDGSLTGDPTGDLGVIGGLLTARVGSNWPQLLTQAVQMRQAQHRQALMDQLTQQQIAGGGIDLQTKQQQFADTQQARDVLRGMTSPQPPVPGQQATVPAPGKGIMTAPDMSQQAGPPQAPAQSPMQPMAPQGGSSVQAPGVTGSGKNQTFALYKQIGDAMASKGLPEQAQKYYDLAEKFRPKLKDEQVRLDPTGKPVVVRNYEDGTTEVSPFSPTASLQYLDTKNAKLPINNYTGMMGGQPIPMGIDPADAQRIAIERGNQGIAQQRLGMDRQRLYFETGMGGAPGAGGGAAGPSGAVGGGVPGQPALPPAIQAAITKSTQEGLNKGGIDYKTALDTTVNTGNDLMMRINESQKALAQFQPGMGAETRLNVARAAQAAGAPDALVNRINGGDVSAKQEFQKLAAQQAMETLKSAMGGSGRITQAEFKVFQANNPNIELDPRAIQKIYDFTKRAHMRNVIEQGSLNGYLQNGGNISQWPAAWTQKQMDAGLMGQPVAQQAPPQGGIRRYNPQTGKIE